MKQSFRWWPKLKNNLPHIILGVFLVSICYLLYSGLGRDYLFDWDEGIYGELGRELLIHKNLFVSFWNGGIWFEKPPGIAWVSALGIALGGSTALGARLLMPLFAVYTLYIVYRLGTHLGSWRHGLLSAGILATLSLFLQRTRAVNTDMPLLAGITTTVLFILENRPAWWVAAAVAGAVWFKGLDGFLALAISAPLFLVKPKKYILRTAYCILLLTLPWHLFAFFAYGKSFYQPYLLEQVIQRASSQIEFHFESRWYYFVYLYQNLGVGVLTVLGIGFASLLLRIFASLSLKKSLTHDPLPMTLLWWLLMPLAVFTLAKTRLFWYILPVYPAIALIIAEAIGRWQRTYAAKLVVTVLAVGVCFQALLISSRSVEWGKTSVPMPDRLQVAMEMSKLGSGELAVLVPPSERMAMAVLPASARLSSSFRYGGMPAVSYYYTSGTLRFFYDSVAFENYLAGHDVSAMISVDDKQYLPATEKIVVTTPTYLGVRKGTYAQR